MTELCTTPFVVQKEVYVEWTVLLLTSGDLMTVFAVNVAALMVVLSPVTKLFLTCAVVFATVFVDISDVTFDPSAFVVVTLTVVGIDVVLTTDVELSCSGVVDFVGVSGLLEVVEVS